MPTVETQPISAESRPVVHNAAVWMWPVLIASIIRIPIAFVAEDQWGDAPIRLDLVERWVQHPGIWWSFKTIYQYGPTPTHLAGLIGLTGLGAHIGARLLVVLCGIVACGMLAVIADRFGGARAGLAAGLMLALSPLHIQASTTFASEGIYLAFLLATILAALDRRLIWCALFAFAAATTRYDAWLWIPLLGLWWLTRKELSWPRRLVACALLGLGPLSILGANYVALGHPLVVIDYINDTHMDLVHGAEEMYGKQLWRLAMIPYWPGAFIVALTPGFAVAVAVGLFRAIRRPAESAWTIAMGGVAPSLYAFRTVVMGTFWPMMRFVVGPAALLATVMPPLRSRTLALCVAIAVASDIGIAIVGADGQPGIELRAQAISPVSRLPSDLRAGGVALREKSGPLALDFVPTYEDILVAYASGMNRYWLLHPGPSIVPARVVAIVGGELDAELRQSSSAFGHHYTQAGGEGRVSWWDLSDDPNH